MKIPASALLPVSLFVAGCAVGPRFARPAASVPRTWTAASLGAGGTTPAPVPASAWWETFGDPEMTSLIRRAAAANLDVRETILRIAEARAQGGLSAAGEWPSLSAGASFERQRISEKTAFTSLLAANSGSGRGGPGAGVSGPASGFANPFNQVQAGFDASWEIDLFGRVRRSVEAARADVRASVEDSRGALVSLSGDTARAYIELRGAQLRRAILREAVRTQGETLKLAEDRRKADLGDDLDVEEAAGQVSAAEAQLPQVQQEIDVDVNRLSLLLALPPGALRAELDAARPIPPVPPEVPIGLPADLVRRRPDIRQAEARLHAATARVGVAVADLFPSVSLTGGAGLSAERLSGLSDWASHYASIGPSLDLPLFDAGRRRATVRLEDVRAREAAVAYSRAVLAALHEVENALSAYRAEQVRRNSLEEEAAHARNALGLARQRYEAGVTSFLAVLDAERGAQQSELALAGSTAAVSTDLVALYKALGGGWE